MRVAGFVVLAMTAACGLDESGLMPFGGPLPEAGADVAAPNDGAPADATPQETGHESGPPQPCSTPPGACVAAVPNDWTLVAFDATGAATCPGNYVGAATVSEPQAGSGACDCSCAVTSSPTCESGTLQRYISTDQSCNQTGVTFNVNGSGCNVLGNTGPLSSYSKSAALGPTGGACNGAAVSNKAAVTTQPGRACAPPTECEEDLCSGKGPSGFATCIETDGAQTCPAGWSATTTLAGDGFDLACSTCGCDLAGTTCSNATLTFYADTQCQSSLAALSVDGQCDGDPASGKTPNSWSYQATTNTACNATGPKSATVTLTNAKTICCK